MDYPLVSPSRFLNIPINQVFQMYHQQQNKWYPQRCLLAHFEAIHYILVTANLLAHNNVTLSYYVAKIECSFEMGK